MFDIIPCLSTSDIVGIVAALFIPPAIITPLSYSVTIELDRIYECVKHRDKADVYFARFYKINDVLTTELSLNALYFLFYITVLSLRASRYAGYIAIGYVCMKLLIHLRGLVQKITIKCLKDMLFWIFAFISLTILSVPIIFQIYSQRTSQTSKEVITAMLMVQFLTFVFWLLLAVITRPFGLLNSLKNS